MGAGDVLLQYLYVYIVISQMMENTYELLMWRRVHNMHMHFEKS